MHNIYPKFDLQLSEPLEQGYVTLTDRGGNKHRNPALYVTGFGWIPCSRKLQNNMTTDPEELVIVVSDYDDEDPPYTSDVWITKTSVKWADAEVII